MFSPSLARPLGYLLSIGFLVGAARAAAGPAVEPRRDVLAPDDGWAPLQPRPCRWGPLAGRMRPPRRTVTVTNRNELIAALAWPDATPKLIYVSGTIDVNVDDTLKPLACKDYQRPDPATGETYSLLRLPRDVRPGGPAGQGQEGSLRRPGKCARGLGRGTGGARAHPRPARTPLFTAWAPTRRWSVPGSTSPAPESGQPADERDHSQPQFRDTADCFPEWSPTDGPLGNWNSAYDTISIRNATHVWIDHNRFADLRDTR